MGKHAISTDRSHSMTPPAGSKASTSIRVAISMSPDACALAAVRFHDGRSADNITHTPLSSIRAGRRSHRIMAWPARLV